MNRILLKKLRAFLTPLVSKYGYTLRESARVLTKDSNVSYVTCRNYLAMLCDMGYAKKRMGIPQLGATYELNRYMVNKLLKDERYA